MKKNISLPFDLIQAYQKSIAWINTRHLRERLILFFGAVIVVLMVWHTCLYKPLKKDIKNKQADITQLNEQISQMKSKTQDLVKTFEITEKSGEREDTEHKQLVEKARKIDQTLNGIQSNLVSPDQLIMALHAILDRQEGLQLLSLDTAPAKVIPMENNARARAKDKSMGDWVPEVYEHDITLVLLGDYFSVLHYLQSLDSLGWRLFWDRLDYKVLDYPAARITIKLHTLSAEQGFNNRE